MKLICYILWLILIPKALLSQGSALLVGGGSENYNQWSDDPYGWFVQMADSGKIINIDVSTASSWYPNYFIWLGADQSSHALRISNRTLANDSITYLELISAKGIFIEGGDQWDYISNWKGTLVEDAIHYVFNNGGAIGGTSAGLAVLGKIVFDARYGSAYPDEVAYNPYNSRVQFTDDFLDILPNIITDSHLHSRGRLGRLIPMMARRIQDYGESDIMGIGVSDKTALCIDENGIAITYGNAAVTIIYASSNSYISCTSNNPVSFTDINFDQLIPYSLYDINSRSLIDPGPYLDSLDSPAFNPNYMDTLLNGSNESAINLGEHTITNLTSGELTAWNGNLAQGIGLGIVPNSIIIPKIYNDYTYDENRWVGGMWICTIHPHFTAIYLDNACTVNISAVGMLSSNKLVYILDTYPATFAGINGTRSTNHCGIIGAKLHFLSIGDQYDLLNHQSLVTSIIEDNPIINRFKLEQNYPNPFNPSTKIMYDLPKSGKVKIEVFNLLGQKIKSLLNKTMPAGSHQVEFTAYDLPSGVYLYRIEAGNFQQVKKMVLLR
jgi:cyanophycinase